MIRVLVVDDHPLVRAGVCSVLAQSEDITVVGEVARARDVVGAVIQLDPDVVVLDARLPDADGMDACEALRDGGHRARVVMLTQLMTERVITKAFDSGVAGFVVKESQAGELRTAVRTVARGDSYLDPRVAGRVVKMATKTVRKKGPYGLTPAELRVISLLPEGLTNQEIADRLDVSYETVKTHLRHAMEKVGLRDRTQVAALVVREGLG